MRELSRDQILAAEDLKTELVPVPEWGADACVRVCVFSLERRALWQTPIGDLEGEERKAAAAALPIERMVAFSIVNAAGEPLFTEDDIPALRRKSAAALDRIIEAVGRINGIGPKAEDTAAKN